MMIVHIMLAGLAACLMWWLAKLAFYVLFAWITLTSTATKIYSVTTLIIFIGVFHSWIV
jgi:hypothetical protein